MKRLTWAECRELKAGNRVTFVEQFDIFPFCIVPQGTTATVSYSEPQGVEVWVLPDNMEVREALKVWEGNIHLHQYQPDPDWLGSSPIAVP